MKLRIEKQPGCAVVVTLTYHTGKKPIVIEGEQLDGLIAMLETAKRADKFTFELQV